MKRIAVLTSGGDAPGMNAAIRAVVKTAVYNNMEVYGVYAGFQGLIDDRIVPFTVKDASGHIQNGGTILETGRSAAFTTTDGRKRAAENLKKYNIEGLVVIGGDGSFRGALDLSKEHGIKVMGIPATIDNDLAYTDITIGFDTAVNNVIDAVNKIRDTMTSHSRVSIVEVMGRHCGELALCAGIACGAEAIVIPEQGKPNVKEIVKNLTNNKKNGKKASIIILAEGAARSNELKEMIFKEADDFEIKSSVLGYIQRGGSPTVRDRILASRLGYTAVMLLKDDLTDKVIGEKKGDIITMDIAEAVAMKKQIHQEYLDIAKVLSL